MTKIPFSRVAARFTAFAVLAFSMMACAEAGRAPDITAPGQPNTIVVDPGDGGGGGTTTASTTLTLFVDTYGTGTTDYYALEFNRKDALGNQVGGTLEQRWHGNSWSNGEVQSVNIGGAIPCNGGIMVEVRRAMFGATMWEAAGSVFITHANGGQIVQYYDPSRQTFGLVRLAFSGCV